MHRHKDSRNTWFKFELNRTTERSSNVQIKVMKISKPMELHSKITKLTRDAHTSSMSKNTPRTRQGSGWNEEESIIISKFHNRFNLAKTPKNLPQSAVISTFQRSHNQGPPKSPRNHPKIVSLTPLGPQNHFSIVGVK